MPGVQVTVLRSVQDWVVQRGLEFKSLPLPSCLPSFFSPSSLAPANTTDSYSAGCRGTRRPFSDPVMVLRSSCPAGAAQATRLCQPSGNSWPWHILRVFRDTLCESSPNIPLLSRRFPPTPDPASLLLSSGGLHRVCLQGEGEPGTVGAPSWPTLDRLSLHTHFVPPPFGNGQDQTNSIQKACSLHL